MVTAEEQIIINDLAQLNNAIIKSEYDKSFIQSVFHLSKQMRDLSVKQHNYIYSLLRRYKKQLEDTYIKYYNKNKIMVNG